LAYDPVEPSAKLKKSRLHTTFAMPDSRRKKCFGGRLWQQMAFDESLPARKSRQERKSSAGIDA
jgi:hypothetical protein